MAASIPKNTDKMEVIGRWKISKLILKGRNTWIHQGIDIENGKIVALKFISKADKSWVKEQTKQIETEIEALQKIRHKHVIKLYAYNLEAKYPIKYVNNSNGNDNDKYISAVLLVLEYASCGELFNLLYYTSGLNENISRTYFKQIISGIELCHNKGIIHRDLRPKNILLNSNYYIKITNFNTSKIIKSDSDFLMNTKFIGSRSYQSPEILLNNNNNNNKSSSHYDFKCDIFSLGVILFILMAGYPPFEEAAKNDKWYKPIIDKKYERFWKYHKNAQIANMAKDLLNKMLTFDPSERISIADIKKHRWFNGVTLSRVRLQMAIQQRHTLSEQLRRQNVRNTETNVADPKAPETKDVGKPYKIELYPLNKIECFEGDVYTFGYNNTRSIYDSITARIYEDSGSSKYNEIDNILYCKMNIHQKYNEEMQIKFIISIYESRLWLNKYLESEDDTEEIINNKEDIIYIVSIQRTEGDELLYRQIKNEFLLQKCSAIFKGLPQWARRMKPALNDYTLEIIFNTYYQNDIIIPFKIKDIIYEFYRGYKTSISMNDDNQNYDQSLLDFKW